jgi:L,D-transpeptidase YbiS
MDDGTGVAQPGRWLRVDVARQVVEFLRDGAVVKTWPVSTSKFGTGCVEGSWKTPTGRFTIAEKVGGGAPEWMEFRGRKATGMLAEPGGERDGVLTRILWLEGLDEANANTKGRYIYFHGTNREDLIGTPASMGCVRMRNADVVELFDLVEVGTPVAIG